LIALQAAEEKQRRKNEKRAALTGVDVKDLEDSQKNTMDINVDENQNDGQGFDGVMSIRPAPLVPPKKKSVEPLNSEPITPVTEGPHSLREVLQKADVLLHVVDARDPVAGLSEALFKEATGKDIILLVNKIGTLFVLSVNGTESIAFRYRTTRISGIMALPLAINLYYLAFSRGGSFLAIQTQPTPSVEENSCQIGRCAWFRRSLAATQ
jgi:hypothetical protein